MDPTGFSTAMSGVVGRISAGFAIAGGVIGWTMVGFFDEKGSEMDEMRGTWMGWMTTGARETDGAGLAKAGG